jgi:hypothetical protein
VDPADGPPVVPSDGLLYGLIQSGKTSIMTVVAAMAADNGFHCIVILTSDIDLLYDQTLNRLRRALRGLTVLGKNDWRDPARFERHLRTPPIVVVCSKNGSKLSSLLNALRTARAGSLSAMIMDDEADQASLNTYTSRGGAQISRVNEAITDFRNFFRTNTYLQVTATPQALFLQRPDHRYRPSFAVLSEPGLGYVGGESFFGPDSARFLREVPLNEVNLLLATNQPAPTASLPAGLRSALLTFLVGATARILVNPTNGYSFLCHVSVNKRDHQHIVRLIDRFKEELVNDLRAPKTKKYQTLVQEIRTAYNDLLQTEPGLPGFDQVLDKIKFYIHGANVKLINATSNEEITTDVVYNIFVGGNKLGRGVTIKNLLVSYYGRNPRQPNSDTVLQHARMYGYRRADAGITRLFLPLRLADHFRLIHQMETGLRDLLRQSPDGRFEGIYVSAPLRATRRNVLDPNSLGFYVAGASYNPTYPKRSSDILSKTRELDSMLASFGDKDPGREVTIDFLLELLDRCDGDPQQAAELWNKSTLRAALSTLQSLFGPKAYVVVRRGRSLNQPRRETQGIITGGEEVLARTDAPTLFMYRQDRNARGEVEVWWPQLRFPAGTFVLAFSFDW